MREPITHRQFHERAGVEDWRAVAGGAGAYFGTGSFAASARFVQAISELAGLDDHQPDLDVRPGGGCHPTRPRRASRPRSLPAGVW